MPRVYWCAVLQFRFCTRFYTRFRKSQNAARRTLPPGVCIPCPVGLEATNRQRDSGTTLARRGRGRGAGPGVQPDRATWGRANPGRVVAGSFGEYAPHRGAPADRHKAAPGGGQANQSPPRRQALGLVTAPATDRRQRRQRGGLLFRRVRPNSRRRPWVAPTSQRVCRPAANPLGDAGTTRHREAVGVVLVRCQAFSGTTPPRQDRNARRVVAGSLGGCSPHRGGACEPVAGGAWWRLGRPKPPQRQALGLNMVPPADRRQRRQRGGLPFPRARPVLGRWLGPEIAGTSGGYSCIRLHGFTCPVRLTVARVRAGHVDGGAKCGAPTSSPRRASADTTQPG